MVDIDFTWPKFTYSNQRNGGQEFKARLDRVFSSGCYSLFPNAQVTHFFVSPSDHTPILLNICLNIVSNHKPFRVEAMWFLHVNFTKIVGHCLHSNNHSTAESSSFFDNSVNWALLCLVGIEKSLVLSKTELIISSLRFNVGVPNHVLMT